MLTDPFDQWMVSSLHNRWTFLERYLDLLFFSCQYNNERDIVLTLKRRDADKSTVMSNRNLVIDIFLRPWLELSYHCKSVYLLIRYITWLRNVLVLVNTQEHSLKQIQSTAFNSSSFSIIRTFNAGLFFFSFLFIRDISIIRFGKFSRPERVWWIITKKLKKFQTVYTSNCREQ